jgi:EPS-associated MarR family transcriptional regulator
MIEHSFREEVLTIIKHIESDPKATQRSLAQNLGISLGKTNYLIKELIKKGFIKTNHFSCSPGKLAKINYILTRKGFNHMVYLTGVYLKIKEQEYNQLQKDLSRLNGADNMPRKRNPPGLKSAA